MRLYENKMHSGSPLMNTSLTLVKQYSTHHEHSGRERSKEFYLLFV